MPVFSYSGINASRSSVRGTVTADSPRQARDQLRGQGVVVQSLSEFDRRRTSLWPSFSARLARAHWTDGSHELSMLLRAGVPMLEALDTLAAQHRGAFRNAIVGLRDRVASGSSLAQAMSEYPEVFDVASIRLIEVGENAGTLEAVLEQLSEYKQRMAQLGDKVFTALLYPAFLVVFGLVAMIFLMTGVLPPLLENLKETVGVLPWPTRIAKGMSDLLVGYGLWLLLISVVVAIGGLFFFRGQTGKGWLDRQLLRLPLLGPLIVKQNVSRIAMIVGLLTRSGITLPSAVEIAAKSTSSTPFRAALESACHDMAAGKELAESLDRSAVFPPLAVRVFSVGRDSGKLDEMLTRLSQDYNQQLTVAAARLTALIEPILILILAVFVGFLLVATILPILQAGNLQSS
ncbi:MAG: type II secretion system F family protein [Pirellula sp.]